MSAVKVIPYTPAHLEELLRTGSPFASSRDLLTKDGYAESIAPGAWSAFDGDRLIGCGGVAEEHPGCATAWTLLIHDLAGPRMLLLTRFAKKVIAACPTRRVQAHADAQFAPASRWLEMLGFQYEGTLRSFSPDGRDMRLYAVVK